MGLALFIFISLIAFLVALNIKLNSELEIYRDYKHSYFREQEQTEAYRACLYIAIKDMLDNNWYDSPSTAFRMLFERINHYKFMNQFEVPELVSRMLYYQDHVKFSHDFEEYLISKGEDWC